MLLADCFSISAASFSVKNAFPASCAGRSKGVMVALVQTPCKSGCPSAVRGGVHFVDWANAIEAEIVRTKTVRLSTWTPPKRYGLRDAR